MSNRAADLAIKSFPSAIAFADALHGMLIESDCLTKDCRNFAWTTTDGGAHWTRRAEVAVRGNFSTSLQMPTALDVYVTDRAKQVTSVTHDGGISWHKLASTGSVATVRGMPDAWLIENHCPTNPAKACTATVSDLSAGSSRSVGSPPTGGLPITGTSRPTASAAYLTLGGVQSASRQIIATSDAGHTWHKIANPCAHLDPDLQAVPGEPAVVGVLCSGQAGAGSGPKTYFVSYSGGQAWAKRPPPELGGYSFDLAQESGASAWRWGNSRADVFHTTDSGRTWVDTLDGRVGDSAGAASYLFTALDENDAWVVDSLTKTILRTTNAGGHWSSFPIPK